MSNKDLIDVIDEMLQKLDNEDSEIINQTQDEFDNDLKEKLDAVAKSKGYETYNNMLVSQVSLDKTKEVNTEFSFILNYVKDAIDNIEYEPRQMGQYKDGHQEALEKYFEILSDIKDIDETLGQCYEEEKNIKIMDLLIDNKLKGYKDGLYLFPVILEDAEKKSKKK